MQGGRGISDPMLSTEHHLYLQWGEEHGAQKLSLVPCPAQVRALCLWCPWQGLAVLHTELGACALLGWGQQF